VGAPLSWGAVLNGLVLEGRLLKIGFVPVAAFMMEPPDWSEAREKSLNEAIRFEKCKVCRHKYLGLSCASGANSIQVGNIEAGENEAELTSKNAPHTSPGKGAAWAPF